MEESKVPVSDKETAARPGKWAAKNGGFMRRPFSFRGRIRCYEFVISYVMSLIACVVLCVMWLTNVLPFGVLLLLLVPVCWFNLAQGAKRCHDLAQPWWMQLVPIYLIIMLTDDDVSKYAVEYGNDPRECE